jgi:uncharacterized oxidoreductase
MHVPHERLQRLVGAVFAAAGCRPPEAECVAGRLVQANLVGHDSHGVIRVPPYVAWLRAGKVVANQAPKVVFENDGLAIVDGQFGFGQVMGEEAVRLGVAKCGRHGVAVVALRNSGHLGRIGDWAELAAAAGKLSLHFVNTSGGGILVAPHGGTQRRLSANPVAAGVPVKDGPPLIMDISTCTIAEGKIRVALNRGTPVPDDCVLDGLGRPTNDPEAFYGPPPGAILPLGGHKGYALGVIVEMLAGALTGGGCSDPSETRVANNMLSVFIDPGYFRPEDDFAAEVRRFMEWIKSSAPASPGGEVLAPGEPEERTRARRLRDGIEVDDTTWAQLRETCRLVGLHDDRVVELVGHLPGGVR